MGPGKNTALANYIDSETFRLKYPKTPCHVI